VIALEGRGSSRYRGFGLWVWTSLIVIFATSMFSDVSRFLNPAGEKYMPGYYAGGQVDFSLPYLGARALLAGENPYTTQNPEFMHKLIPGEIINGKVYTQLYPPGHLLTYVPLAWVYGPDTVAAGRCFVIISMVLLVGIGLLTWRLVQRARGEPVSPLFAFLAVASLTLQPGVQLGLERGQSDILTSLLCWGAMFSVIHRAFGLAAFLTAWAVNVKAYPILFAAGIGVLMLRRKAFGRALLGALAALAVFLLPAVRFLDDGFQGTLHRSNMFWPAWFNHSFKNLVYHTLSPAAADAGRLILTFFAVLVAGVWGWRARQYLDVDRSPMAVLSLAIFGTTSLAAVLGYSALSVSYNLILTLPGVVVLAASQDRVAEELRLGPVGRHLLGVATTCTAFALFLGRWGEYPLSGLGLVMELGLLAVLALRLGIESGARQYTVSGA